MSGADRVLFVCCDDHGGYSPGVYLHGSDGGGPACLKVAVEAASRMRHGEAADSAAGLCGYLFKDFGDDAASSGGLSLFDAPIPRPDGSVDWSSYCPDNVDLILINVDQGVAECFVSSRDSKPKDKPMVAKITGLKLGGRRLPPPNRAPERK